MGRHARKERAVVEHPPPLFVDGVPAPGTAITNPHITEASRAETEAALGITALAFGRLKDGRHVAMEVRLEGQRVVSHTPLCASMDAAQAGKAWEAAAYTRFYAKSEYSSVERRAHALDSRKVALEDVEYASALALPRVGRTRCVVAFELAGSTVTEPEVLARGDLNYCWGRLEFVAATQFLPRRKRA